MPGILPMKIIKVGSSNSQSRIAQACDRCRSKKIRCDGVRPCCTQCSNVGFECKTSDKLSRRAFPKGYTESLEERIRSLEGEVRVLKDLLDEKDEKIDMLSKMHSNRPSSLPVASNSPPTENRKEPSPQEEDTFRVENEEANEYLGASSGRTFVDSFRRRSQESGKCLPEFCPEEILNLRDQSTLSPAVNPNPTPNFTPPRLFSDKCVNIFMQEWAPLFPVLHKELFLSLYHEYLLDPESIKDHYKLAQLHLVFSIAGLATDLPDKEHISLCETQWRTALDHILEEKKLYTLECLILAIICSIQTANYDLLHRYRKTAVGLAYRLGLHLSHSNQKEILSGELAVEMRKRIFWTLYTVDCFSASLLGLPKSFQENDIAVEYPLNIDEEHMNEKSYQTMSPKEPTRISSALALFRCSRILSKVLDQIYPKAATYDLSLQTLSNLEKELDEWFDSLPAHLKLSFVQDKPSTDVTGSRSALLSLSYYYVRSLIHRPAVGSALGAKSSPYLISVADSSKHIIQIIELLEERNMTFSFCLNKSTLLTLCGFSFLYQGLDLKQQGKLIQDNQRLVNIIIRFLEKSNASGASDIKNLASSLITLDSQTMDSKTKSALLRTCTAMSAPKAKKTGSQSPVASRKKLQPGPYKHIGASMSENDILVQQEKVRRATLPNISTQPSHDQTSATRSSYDGTRPDPPMMKRENRYLLSQLSSFSKPRHNQNPKTLNLDYFPLSTPVSSQPSSPPMSRTAHPGLVHRDNQLTYTKIHNQFSSDFGLLLSSFDRGQANIHSAIYGGPVPSLTEPDQTAKSNSTFDWSCLSWDEQASPTLHDPLAAPGSAQSVLSFSGESHSSGDELSTSDLGLSGNTQFQHDSMQPPYENYTFTGMDPF